MFTKQYKTGTGQRAVMLCGWEGNRRSGVVLAMRHRLSGIPTYGLNGLGKGDEHPTYELQWSVERLDFAQFYITHDHMGTWAPLSCTLVPTLLKVHF